MSDFHVAIAGAGLSGLALALALNKQKIKCTLYEARDAPLNTGGGVLLTPNGLTVLQLIDVYDGITEKAYAFDKGYFQLGHTGTIVGSQEYGNKVTYGKQAFRAYRYTVLEELLKQVRHEEIPIHFNRHITSIITETSEQVTWQFADGSSGNASILVGADGIHSTIRKYVAPDIKPIYGRCVFLTGAVPVAQLGLPSEDLKDLNNESNKHPMPSGVIADPYGAFIFAPQSKTGDEVMISVMRPFPEEPKHWGPIDADKDLLRRMFQDNSDKFPEVVQNAVADIPGKQLRIWPAYQIPALDSWTSVKMHDGHGRVVVLGDAAHAIPPSAGQGVNMAFEDVYMFAGVLGSMGGALDAKRLQRALRGWQQFRQERIDIVLRINKQMELRRLPMAAGTDPETLNPLNPRMNEDWQKLFNIDFEEAVKECIRRGDVE